MIRFIQEIAREAGAIIRDGYHSELTNIEHKGQIDIVTEIDLQSEIHLKKRISQKFPDDNIISEETSSGYDFGQRNWIIDPLDGTTNFSHKFPVCAVSIGLEIDGIISSGVVYNPILDEMFSAERGKGAFYNDESIRVSETGEISNSLIATGFPYDRWQNGDHYIREYLAFMKRCQGVRRVGAAAVDLCYVAMGRLDGFFERKLKPWDMAAGSLIVAEAGGNISRFNGNKWHYLDDTIIASNGIIHNRMIDILKNTQ
ncbi:MAG: inositol monophosphatase [Candidatus Cloacimonetes bacterium]|nr:inositol monophosphatase [Candidatus Cloacimonadota bacterium]